MTMRHFADKPVAARSSAIAPGHVCGCGSFIDEHELSWIELALHPQPCPPRRRYVRAVLLGRVQAPRRSWPTRWNEFLPISMPITAISLLSFSDMVCSFVLGTPWQAFLRLAGAQGARP